MSWSALKEPLPCRAWTIIDSNGRMILSPVQHKESAERMAAENVGGSLRKAIAKGYRIVEIEIVIRGTDL